MNLDIEKNYVIRPVKRKDSKRIWGIRNSPLVRQNSNNSKEIFFVDHNKWFKEKYFSKKNNYCFILEDENRKVIGYCRFDFSENDNAFIISIALDPDYHRKGLGSFLLAEAIKKLLIKKDILAEVKKNNFPSLKLFQKNNFMIYNEDENNYYLKYSN